MVQNGMAVGVQGRLQRVFNACVRFVCLARRRDHITPYYKQLNWLKIEDRRKHHLAVFTKKLLDTGTPAYLRDTLQLLSTHHQIGTRYGGSLLMIPRHRSRLFENSFSVAASRLWNSLPLPVREQPSMKSFCGQYHEQLVGAYHTQE